MRWRKACFFAALLILASAGAPPGAWAQARQTSAIVGTIRDGTGAVLPGVTITLSSPTQLGGAQTTLSDAQGTYRFPGLTPGLFELVAQLQGFRTVRRAELLVPLATTVTVDVTLEVASVAETVTVTGESPVVDIKSSAANTQLDNAILQNLPTGRFQPDVINLTPGVSASTAFGGTQSSNALLMDGVDVSDPEGGSPWSFFNFNWVQEVQVVSLGANAEYGEFTGVAANSIVRSGSNRFSGLGEYWTIRNNWLGKNTGSLSQALQEKFKPLEIETYWDSTEQIGGPVKKDKLFFFTGFQYLRRHTRPAGFNGKFTTEHDPRVIGKVNWAAAQNVKVEGFVEWDKYDITGRGAGPTRPTTETTALEPSPEYNWNGQVTWNISAKTLLNVRNGGYTGYFPVEPTPPQSRSGPYPHFDASTNIYSVNVPYYGRFDRDRNVTAATFTRYADNFAGKSHEFKFGFEFERSKIRNESGYPGGRYYYDYGGEPYLVFLWDGYVTDAVGKRTTVYAQDTWTVNDRLTINPGVRFNFNRGSVPVKGTVLSTNPVSPRIGLAYDLLGDHKTVVRAHYGRYHDALLGGMYEFMDLTHQNPHITAEVLGPNQFAEIDRRNPQTNLGIDQSVTHSYVDQYLVGIERELFTDFSLTAQYVRRNFENFMGFIDTSSSYEPVQRRDPGPDNRLGTADDGQLITVYNLLNPGHEFKEFTNPKGAFRRYNGFQIIGRKRYSRNWQASLSYTWSKTEGTVNNSLGNNSGGSDLGQTGAFANPNRGINNEGRSQVDYTHQAKLEGTYRLPLWGGFNISGFYRYISGSPWGRRASIRGLDQGSTTVRIEPRGMRRLDPINTLDLRVEKTIPLGDPSRTAGFFVDIFNVNNRGVNDSLTTSSGGAVIDTSGSTFAEPRRWLDPRTIRLGVRFTF